MTRINVGIEPSQLPSKLLIAEHREITRIPNAVRNHKANTTNIPPRFTLGTGHVRFLYDKLLYLAKRYDDLYQECRLRNYAVTDKRSAFNDLPPHLFNDYHPTEDDKAIVIERIHERGFQLI